MGAREKTIDRLHQLAARDWRPMDCALIAVYCDRLDTWAVTAAELLAARP